MDLGAVVFLQGKNKIAIVGLMPIRAVLARGYLGSPLDTTGVSL
jgi:hypothetical protein